MKSKYAVSAYLNGAIVRSVTGWQHEGTCRLLARSWMNSGVIHGERFCTVSPDKIVIYRIDGHSGVTLASLTAGGWSDGWH